MPINIEIYYHDQPLGTYQVEAMPRINEKIQLYVNNGATDLFLVSEVIHYPGVETHQASITVTDI